MLDGALLTAGVDLMALPLDRALNVIYYQLLSHTDDKQRSFAEMQLTAPLPGEDISVSAEEDARLFNEIFAQANDGKTAR